MNDDHHTFGSPDPATMPYVARGTGEVDNARDEDVVNDRPSLTFDDRVALGTGAALAVIALPFAYFPSATPRMVVLLCALPLGLAGLISAARTRDRCSLVALTFVVWALICALMADSRWMSVLGSFGRDTSALVVAAGFGVWAIGRRLSDAGTAVMPRLLLGCFGLSAAVGLLQIAFRANNTLFGVVGGRAHGLAGGHIYFGATMAGAACLVAVTLRSRSLLWCALVFLFAAGANLSGSRFPVVVGLVAGLAIFVWRRDVRTALAWLGVYVGALIASTILLSSIPGTESATDRAGAESSGRLQAWKYGWSALLDRPIFGWGPAGFRPAIQGRYSASFTAAHAENELSQIWFDAHNIVVAVAVSYGFVGLVLVGVFVVLAVKSARGPLAVFAAVVAATWLLEPAGLSTFPLVMICLGASMVPVPALATTHVEPQPSSAAQPALLLLLVGVLVSAVYFVGDQRIDRGMLNHDPAPVEAVARWAPWDPITANLAAVAHANFDGDEAAIRDALVWMERAHERQPDFPFYLNKIAQLRLMLGDSDGARSALEQALALQPWNVQTLQLAYQVADGTTNDSFSEDARRERLCTLGAAFCPEPSPAP